MVGHRSGVAPADVRSASSRQASSVGVVKATTRPRSGVSEMLLSLEPRGSFPSLDLHRLRFRSSCLLALR